MTKLEKILEKLKYKDINNLNKEEYKLLSELVQQANDLNNGKIEGAKATLVTENYEVISKNTALLDQIADKLEHKAKTNLNIQPESVHRTYPNSSIERAVTARDDLVAISVRAISTSLKKHENISVRDMLNLLSFGEEGVIIDVLKSMAKSIPGKRENNSQSLKEFLDFLLKNDNGKLDFSYIRAHKAISCFLQPDLYEKLNKVIGYNNGPGDQDIDRANVDYIQKMLEPGNPARYEDLFRDKKTFIASLDSDENFYLDKLYSACEAHPTNYLLGLARVYGGLSQDDTARLDKCFNKKYNLEEKEFNEELLEVVGIYEKVANPLKLDSAELDDIYNDMKSRNSAQLYAPSYKSQIEKIQEGRKTAIDFITEYKKPPETKQPKSNISIFSMFRFTAKKDMYDPNDFAMFCVYADPAQQSELFSDSSTEDLANFLSKLEIGSKLYNTVTDPDFIVDFYEEDSGKFLNIFSSDTNLQNLITEAEKNIKYVDENEDVFLKFGEIRDLLSNSKSAHFPRN